MKKRSVCQLLDEAPLPALMLAFAFETGRRVIVQMLSPVNQKIRLCIHELRVH